MGAGVRFLAALLVFTVLAVVVINIIMTQLGERFGFWDWITSFGTALVVGTFAGLIVLGRKKARQGAEAQEADEPDEDTPDAGPHHDN